MQVSGGGRVQQGDSRHRHGELWIAGVVTAPKGELVAGSANDNRFAPTADQALLGKDDVPRLDGVPRCSGRSVTIGSPGSCAGFPPD